MINNENTIDINFSGNEYANYIQAVKSGSKLSFREFLEEKNKSRVTMTNDFDADACNEDMDIEVGDDGLIRNIRQKRIKDEEFISTSSSKKKKSQDSQLADGKKDVKTLRKLQETNNMLGKGVDSSNEQVGRRSQDLTEET